jgi:branched-chain amino acid transport system ATP-binding protein
MTGNALLRAERVSAGYGAGPVIREIDVEVGPGELVALLGANGAGKTTTLLAMAGAVPLSAGRLLWEGAPLNEPLHKRARRGLAVITDDRAIFMRLSVMDNLLVGRCDVERAFGLFPELQPLASRKAGLLSGGEQQMLTLARAVARNPKLLLFDELSLGLAPLAVARILTALRAAVDTGMGALIVEQHVTQILQVATRAYVMSRGRIVLSGTAQEIRERWGDVRRAYLSADEPARAAADQEASQSQREA